MMDPRSDGNSLPLFTSFFADKSRLELAAPRQRLVKTPNDGGKTSRRVIDSSTPQQSICRASICQTSVAAGFFSSQRLSQQHPVVNVSHQTRPPHDFFPPRAFSRTKEGPVDVDGRGGGGGGGERPDCFDLSSNDNDVDRRMNENDDEEEDDGDGDGDGDDSGDDDDGDGDDYGHPNDVACEAPHAIRASEKNHSSEGTSRGSRGSCNYRGEPHTSRNPHGGDSPISGYGVKLTLHSMLPSYSFPARPGQSSNGDTNAARATAAVGDTGITGAVVASIAINSENGTTRGFSKPVVPAAALFSAQPAPLLRRVSHEIDDEEEEEGEGGDDEETDEAEEVARDSPPIYYSACHEKAADSPFPFPSPSPSAASAQRSPATPKPPKSKRKSKLRLSPAQIEVLESHFTDIEREIKLETRLKLASQLRLKPRQVAVWFQNRRVKHATLAREGELTRLRGELAQAHAELAELRKENERAKREMGDLAEEHAELKSKYDALLPRSSKRKTHENESMSAPPQKRVKEEIFDDPCASAGCAEHSDAHQCRERISDSNGSDKIKTEACNTDEVLMKTFSNDAPGCTVQEASRKHDKDNRKLPVTMLPVQETSTSKSATVTLYASTSNERHQSQVRPLRRQGATKPTEAPTLCSTLTPTSASPRSPNSPRATSCPLSPPSSPTGNHPSSHSQPTSLVTAYRSRSSSFSLPEPCMNLPQLSPPPDAPASPTTPTSAATTPAAPAAAATIATAAKAAAATAAASKAAASTTAAAATAAASTTAAAATAAAAEPSPICLVPRCNLPSAVFRAAHVMGRIRSNPTSLGVFPAIPRAVPPKSLAARVAIASAGADAAAARASTGVDAAAAAAAATEKASANTASSTRASAEAAAAAARAGEAEARATAARASSEAAAATARAGRARATAAAARAGRFQRAREAGGSGEAGGGVWAEGTAGAGRAGTAVAAAKLKRLGGAAEAWKREVAQGAGATAARAGGGGERGGEVGNALKELRRVDILSLKLSL